jgi:hypothetical protein
VTLALSHRRHHVVNLALYWLLPLAALRAAEGPSPDVTEPPAFGGFLVVPPRDHVLTAPDLPEADCHPSNADLARILGKVNAIWNKSRIHWGLESLVRDPAARWEELRRARDLCRPATVRFFTLPVPEASRATEGVNVSNIRELQVNGVMIDDGGDLVLVKERARLGSIEGSIDEPIPRVTAHELGDFLGLKHRQDRANLLASDTTGTRPNVRAVTHARERAWKLEGSASVVQLPESVKPATAKGDAARACRLWSWRAEVPGPGAAEAHAECDAIPTSGDRRDLHAAAASDTQACTTCGTLRDPLDTT